MEKRIIQKRNNELIEKTIKSYFKHFGLKIKNGFIYKKDIAIYTEDINKRNEVLSFLMGLSCVLDSKDFWGLKCNIE